MKSKWKKTSYGYFHSTVRTVVVRRTSGNPHRSGDWFCSGSGFGMTAAVSLELARRFPGGVKTLKAAKAIVDSIAVDDE